MTDLRITHAIAEVLREGDPDIRITHAVVEVLRSGGLSDLRITHAIVEVLRENIIEESTTVGNFFLLF